MKILYIITLADNGGAQKYVLELATAFHGSIAAGIEKSALFQQAMERGIPSYPVVHLKRNINLYHDILAVIELVKIIKKVNPDIVHTNSSKAGVLGSIAGWLCRKKVVFTAHGFFYLYDTFWLTQKFYILAESFVSLLRDTIITVSNQDAANAMKFKIAPAAKLRTIHNGIEQINFLSREQARTKLGIPDAIVIGVIAQLYERKGYDLLIKVLTNLHEFFPNVILVAIGDGPEYSNLKQQTEKAGLTEAVYLVGSLSGANQYLKAFDIFVLPSRREGFPFVVLEALQAGLPIITTDVGGSREALGNSGVLVPSNDLPALEQVLTKLLNDGSLRQSLAAKATARSAEFTLENMVNQTQSVYQKLLAGTF